MIFFLSLSIERKKTIEWDFLLCVYSFQICSMVRRQNGLHSRPLWTSLYWASQQFCETHILMPLYRWAYRVQSQEGARRNMDLSWPNLKGHTLSPIAFHSWRDRGKQCMILVSFRLLVMMNYKDTELGSRILKFCTYCYHRQQFGGGML